MPRKSIVDTDERMAAVVEKLVEVSTDVKCGKVLNEAENGRVDEALTISAPDAPPQGRRNDLTYQILLRSVIAVLGQSGVVLCALGLGKSAVAALPGRVRTRLGYHLGQRKRHLATEALQEIADARLAIIAAQHLNGDLATAVQGDDGLQFPTGLETMHAWTALQIADDLVLPDASPPVQGQELLRGLLPPAANSYALNLEDVQAAVDGGEICGTAYLIDTFWDRGRPFMIVPVSSRLALTWASERPKV